MVWLYLITAWKLLYQTSKRKGETIFLHLVKPSKYQPKWLTKFVGILYNLQILLMIYKRLKNNNIFLYKLKLDYT